MSGSFAVDDVSAVGVTDVPQRDIKLPYDEPLLLHIARLEFVLRRTGNRVLRMSGSFALLSIAIAKVNRQPSASTVMNYGIPAGYPGGHYYILTIIDARAIYFQLFLCAESEITSECIYYYTNVCVIKRSPCSVLRARKV